MWEEFGAGIDAWIGAEVITENSLTLGWVKQIRFKGEVDRRIVDLTISGTPCLWLPDFIAGIYELPETYIIGTGTNVLLITGGEEHRLERSTIGILNRLGLIKSPWQVDNPLIAIIRPSNAIVNDDDRDHPGFANVTRSPKPDPSPLNEAAEIPSE